VWTASVFHSACNLSADKSLKTSSVAPGTPSSKLRIGTPATRQICRKRSEGFFQRDRQIEINIIALSRKESMGID
jgi:hypothetical protein